MNQKIITKYLKVTMIKLDSLGYSFSVKKNLSHKLGKIFQNKISINPSLYPFLENCSTGEQLSDFIDFCELFYGLVFKPLRNFIIC